MGTNFSVKLVAETGVGTVAAGVSKAHADHVLSSGADAGVVPTGLGARDTLRLEAAMPPLVAAIRF